MYLRTTKRKNKDGTEVAYYQLAETVYNRNTKRPEAHVIHNFGRTDALDVEALRRLASSILRVCSAPLDEGGADTIRLQDVDMEESRSYGPLYVAEALWESLGIGAAIRHQMELKRCHIPHDRLLFALAANRLEAPCSKLACHEHWLSEEAYLPEAKDWKLDQFYRAMDFLYDRAEAIERDVFFKVAEVFNADVDLVFWDTTNFWCEIDEEDEEGDDQALPALRKRGHNKEGRDGQPQISVGLALTRDGLPVRSWVFPGNTVDASTVAKMKEDLRGWRLGRCILVGDAGMYSEANKEALSKGLGRYILAVPMRKLKDVKEQALNRPGRYREVRPNLEVKEVTVGEGERRTRYFVCRNLEEAGRQKKHREKLLAMIRAELSTLKQAKADSEKADDVDADVEDQKEIGHSKRVCELLASRRFGKYLRKTSSGVVEIDTDKVHSEERMDGKYVLTTNDDTLSADDVALGYKSMMIIEGCFRRMKTTSLRTRPMFHWTPRRIIAHVKLCVLALLLQRAAEIQGEDSWRNIYFELRRIRAIRYVAGNRTIVQITRPTLKGKEILKKLGIPLPKKLLFIEENTSHSKES